jgi:Ca-activated chloride channel homolog
MKSLKRLVWAMFVASFAGCDAAPPGPVVTNPPRQTLTRSMTSWIAAQTADKVDEIQLRKNFLIVLDGSGSMSGSKMDQAKEAVDRFSKKVPVDANLGLLVFDSAGISERVPLGTGNRPQFAKAVSEVRAAGGTPLRTSITKGYELLRKQASRQQGYGEYHLVVVTDGEANPGEEPDQIVNTILGESPVVFHTIGFHIGERHSLNQKGRILYKAADDQASLERGLAEVLAEAEKFN